jgi:DNA-binding NarL/FixJ family response regulator
VQICLDQITKQSQFADRALIVDDHALVREGLRAMLSGVDGIRVVAEAKDGQ